MTRVAVFPIDAVGHLNPMLAVCRAMAADAGPSAIRAFGRVELRSLFHRVGTHFAVTMRDVPAGPAGDLAWRSFIRPLDHVDETMRAVRDFAPDVVLFDPFSVLGAIAWRTLRVPSAALVTMAGYGTLGESFVLQHGWGREDVREANAQYVRRFGVNLQAEGALPVLFPAADLSIVSTVERLAIPADPTRQPLLSRLVQPCGRTIHVGPCTGAGRLMEDAIRTLAPDRDVIDTRPAFPIERLAQAKRAGRRILLFSLGTVLTDFRYESPVGGAPTGRQFLEHMLRVLLRAIGNDERMLLVAATGHRFAAHDRLPWPADAIVRPTVPQQEILERFADVFITHHGASSQAESILSGVPMVSLPGVGDQVPNARMAKASGLAVSLWDIENPFGTCDADSMREAIRIALDEEGCRKVLASLGAELRSTGGAAAAARSVKALAADPTRCREAAVPTGGLA